MQCSLSDCSTVGGLVWLIDFISHYCMGVDHFTSHRAIVRCWVQCVEESDLQMPKPILLHNHHHKRWSSCTSKLNRVHEVVA